MMKRCLRRISGLLALFIVILVRTSTGTEAAKTDNSIFNVLDFGAKGDGVKLDTKAIQTAIDACTKTGGTVVFPRGRYLTGTIKLKSHVTLDLPAGAVILGSTDTNEYATDIVGCAFINEKHINKCLVYAEGAENIAITGMGAIDGQGASFPGATPEGKAADRPMLIRFVKCTNVALRDVSLRNAASWCTNLLSCTDVRVQGISIFNRCNANNDGIDITNSQKVRISDSIFITQDDGICFQSMSNDDPVRDITITNCVFSTRWAAIRSGGAHRGGIRNVTVSNCVIYDTYGCGIKLQVSGNCTMEDMTFSNIVMKNVSAPISLRFGNVHYNGEAFDESHPWGTMRNILFNNIRASVLSAADLKKANPDQYPGEEKQCISICGIPNHPIEGITLSNIQVTYPGGGTSEEAAKRDLPELEAQYPEYFMWGVLPAYGLYARHATGLSLNNVRFELASDDIRPAIVCDQVRDLDVAGLRAGSNLNMESLLRLRSTRDAFIQGCKPLGDARVFVRVEGKDSSDIAFGSNDLHRVKTRFEVADGADVKAVVAESPDR